MTTPSPPDLTALLGSRICHDLISPLGAISNGVELLELSGLSDVPELALIADSIAAANARIRFFRIAFGVASAEQQVTRTEIEEILAGLTNGSRMQIDWRSEAGVPRAQARLVFLLILCFESALPRGGTITVTQSGPEWEIACREPPVLAADRQLWRHVEGAQSPPGDEVTPAKVHFLLVAQAALNDGLSIAVTHGETSLSVHVC